MDITPLIPEEMKIITAYGAEGFIISGENVATSVLVMPEKRISWPAGSWGKEAVGTLLALLAEGEKLEILLIGCGEKHLPLSVKERLAFKPYAASCDMMTTGAACRTYNILLAEGRKVGAALIKISHPNPLP